MLFGFIYLIIYFDLDSFTMSKQGCFAINIIRNWGTNLFALDKGAENIVIILEIIKMKMQHVNHGRL